jgi:hypothetical protein
LTIGGLSPDNTEDLEFRVQKFEYNQYSLIDDIHQIKGILRVATVPYRILSVKKTADGKPRFLMQSVYVISFVNKGEPREPSPVSQITTEIEDINKLDITDNLDVLTEPYNIYITVNTKRYFAIRAKSSIIKAELLVGRYDYYGNPMFNLEVNTAISYAFANQPST